MALRGVVLAGGSGSRLFPLTLVTNKHLLPVYDRPMIYYPLAALREMGCREVMVVVGGRSVGDVLELLHDGSDVDLDLCTDTSAVRWGSRMPSASHVTSPAMIRLRSSWGTT